MNDIDFSSGTWHAVERHVNQRIEELRERLEVRNTPESETEALRGGIEELRGLLNLAKPSKIPADVLREPEL